MMESGNSNRGRLLLVSKEFPPLQTTEESQNLLNFRTRVRHLEEVTRRLIDYTVLDGEVVMAQLRLIEQSVHEIRRLIQHPANEWPYR
jgi:hypothetical protein